MRTTINKEINHLINKFVTKNNGILSIVRYLNHQIILLNTYIRYQLLLFF